MVDLTVIGSLNIDLVVRTPRMPVVGETLPGSDFKFIPGGKGGNQAVAASRAGAGTQMIGCIGQDVFGSSLVESLKESNVDIMNIQTMPDVSTGIATILVDDFGENRIVIVSGANAFVLPEHIDSLWDKIIESEIILIQNEIPIESGCHIIDRANAEGIKVFYNPAPACSLPDEVLQKVDTLIMNEIECQTVAGIEVNDVQSSIGAAESLIHKGVKTAIVTLGLSGAVLVNKERQFIQPAFNLDVVDTTAAGDTFVGCYAACTINGLAEQEALYFSTAAAGLSVTKPGAQPSIPTWDEVNDFILKEKGQIG